MITVPMGFELTTRRATFFSCYKIVAHHKHSLTLVNNLLRTNTCLSYKKQQYLTAYS